MPVLPCFVLTYHLLETLSGQEQRPQEGKAQQVSTQTDWEWGPAVVSFTLCPGDTQMLV